MLNLLKIKIFSDGADRDEMLQMYAKPFINGLTTNPSLMKKAGVTDYVTFCKEILLIIKDKPISFEVFSDDFKEMERQALQISSWGRNVYVKIPITNTKQQPSYSLIKTLVSKNIKVNVTAIMTLEQVCDVMEVLSPNVPSYVSVFAGRIADTGRDPIPIMKAAVEILRLNSSAELIWASPRELLNIFHANEIGCHIITVTSDILNKLPLIGYDLNKYSLDTVKMFYKDSVEAKFII
jgi:transaldolase